MSVPLSGRSIPIFPYLSTPFRSRISLPSHSNIRHAAKSSSTPIRSFSTATRALSSSPLFSWSLTLGTALTFYTLGSFLPPHFIPFYRLFYPPRSDPLHLINPDSQEAKQYEKEKEDEMFSLPIVSELRAKHPDWILSRPYVSVTNERKLHNLTSGVLHGPGKLSTPPLIFTSPDPPTSPKSESIILIHLGRSLCGHDGVIHGGLLATILDESLARQAFLSFEHKVVVTARLEVEYKSPTWADQWVIVRTRLEDGEECKGRKRWVRGSIEELGGKKLVDAKALFVQPKMANLISNAKSVKEAITESQVKTT